MDVEMKISRWSDVKKKRREMPVLYFLLFNVSPWMRIKKKTYEHQKCTGKMEVQKIGGAKFVFSKIHVLYVILYTALKWMKIKIHYGLRLKNSAPRSKIQHTIVSSWLASKLQVLHAKVYLPQDHWKYNTMYCTIEYTTRGVAHSRLPARAHV